jgi:hypothetical protein
MTRDLGFEIVEMFGLDLEPDENEMHGLSPFGRV